MGHDGTVQAKIPGIACVCIDYRDLCAPTDRFRCIERFGHHSSCPKTIQLAVEEIERLRTMHAAACDRVVGQSELLSRTAEGKAVLLLEKLRRIDHAIRTGTLISFDYRNHRGESARRSAWASELRHGATEFHPTPQWIMSAWCNDRKQLRSFSVEEMTLDQE